MENMKLGLMKVQDYALHKIEYKYANGKSLSQSLSNKNIFISSVSPH